MELRVSRYELRSSSFTWVDLGLTIPRWKRVDEDDSQLESANEWLVWGRG